LVPTGAGQAVLEVIDLKYRSAEQVVPMLKPLLAPGGTISSIRNQVVIRTTPQNMAELRKVLDAVDTRPRRLMISVRQDLAGADTRSEAELSGSIGAGTARATVPGTPRNEGGTVVIRRGDDRAKARVLNSRSASNDRGVQTLQVMEGGEAWIRVGQSVPLQEGSVTISPFGAQVAQSAQYRDVGTGFRVKPRVSGDTVTLEIGTRRDSVANADASAFDVQRVDTVVTGRLGEWMELGGIAQESTRSDRGTLSRSTAMGSENRSVYVKVDALP
ncbi:MAG TPA: secretin N-terminal domain-containing protein, partial [Burkholderiales bacterium]|nr:secretin N-terminal domain-containing protein [Burkholderiales bacterium]